MVRHLIARSRDDAGFTLMELLVYITILTIILSSFVYFFVNMRDHNMVDSASQQVKAAMERALNIAKNENQTITLTFYSSAAGGHPNSYTIERADGAPEVPAPGASTYQDDPPYYVKIQEGAGGLSIASNTTIVYQPEGTILNINSSGSVTVSCSGKSKTITVNPNGEVSL